MIHSQVQASDIQTMDLKVICAPMLKSIPNQDPNQMRKRKCEMKSDNYD